MFIQHKSEHPDGETEEEEEADNINEKLSACDGSACVRPVDAEKVHAIALHAIAAAPRSAVPSIRLIHWHD